MTGLEGGWQTSRSGGQRGSHCITRLGPMSARAGLEWWGLGDARGSHQDMAGALTVPLGGALVRWGHRPLQGVNGCSVPGTKPGPGGSRAQPEQICRTVVLDPRSHSSAQQRHSRRGRGRVVWCRAHVVHLPRTQPSWDLPKGPGPSPPMPPPSGAPPEEPPHAPCPRPQAPGGTAHRASCSDTLQSAGQAPGHTRPSDHIASCTRGYISQDCEV